MTIQEEKHLKDLSRELKHLKRDADSVLYSIQTPEAKQSLKLVIGIISNAEWTLNNFLEEQP
jgi:hypothetical protein